ncbi:signal recognition particle subunit SRP72-like [Pomacea canaliculata]|uniref:signal recognition particle subunit SRP72-like n=1 Tax=Pomacea canaliculata TaxID=400727 RepID=UPI000D73AFCE|nr:signal recognition particle subunit SRP72-like [Pomacea canaliculata]
MNERFVANMAQKGGKEKPDLVSWYADLNRCGQTQEYEKAIKIAGRILHHFPGELKAFQCRVVSFILQDKFEEALTAIGRDKEKAEFLQFEKAYCEYRLNRTEQALSTLRSVTNLDVRTKELLAQVLYRLEQYQECYTLYKDLLKNTQDEFDAERQTNMAAVVAALQMWDVQNVEDAGLDEDSYEVCYNNACYQIGCGNLDLAELKLKKAEEFLRNDSDLTEEELDEELAIIRVQMGYLLQKKGRCEEAAQLYNQVQKNRPSDVGIGAVLSNNLVTINKDQNVFDSKRKMKSATGDNVKGKLTSVQKQIVAVNQCLLHMYSNQGELCLKQAEELHREDPDLMSCVLISAAQHVRDKNMDKAMAMLQAYRNSHPDKQFTLQLMMAQIYLSQGSVYAACDALKALGDLQHKPGVVSALVTLYMGQEDRAAASDVLVNAVNWYKKNQPKSPDLAILTQANSAFQLKHGNADLAAQMLEDLRKQNPKDPMVLAQLISAYSQFNPNKAKEISRDLPPVSEIVREVDVDALESAFSTLGPKYMKKMQKGEPSPGPSGDMLLKKKKKKKKGKLPKNCEAGGDIDPERWLPRRERSYYRGKRKDKRREIGKGTQGSGTVASELDASKVSPGGSDPSSPRPGSAAVSSPSSGATASPQAAPAAAGPRQQKPAQAQKKKKKKGGVKW